MRQIYAIFCSIIAAILFVVAPVTADSSSLLQDSNRDAAESHAAINNVVFVGDSYCEGSYIDNKDGNDYSRAWAKMTADALSLKNYIISCKGGTGFSHFHNGARFIDLIDQAKAQAENPDEIEWVIIAGGYNDYNDSDEDIMNYSAELFARAQENFPNAQLLVGFNAWNSDNQYVQEQLDRVLLDIRQIVENYNGATFIDHLEDVLYEHPEYFTSDHLHPNEDGQAELAKHLAAFLQERADALLAEQAASENKTERTADYSFVLWLILGTAFIIYLVYGLRRIAAEKQSI